MCVSIRRHVAHHASVAIDRAQVAFAGHTAIDFTLGRQWASTRCAALRPTCARKHACDADALPVPEGLNSVRL